MINKRFQVLLTSAILFALVLSLMPGQSGHAEGNKALLSVPIGAPGLSYRYIQTFGVTGEPYFADTTHINRPLGLFMDSSDNLYVTEEQGKRVLKYDTAGSNLLALGQAGVCITDDYMFCGPTDTTLDGSGNLWVADGNRVVEYDPSGTFIQQLPDTDPWNSGDDDTHFNWVNGIAFDSTGRMFVSDTNNQRVQVYTFTDDSPVYSATIGVTGESGDDNDHFNFPYRLAVDSSDQLYVVDQGNNRVQQCTFSGGWTCAAFDSGLNVPQGITVDGGDNVYVADTFNGNIRKCSSAGTCADFVTGTYGLNDLAVDSSGNVYGAATYEAMVVKYNSNGELTGTFVGEEFVPYLTDDYHYFHPRVAIDSSNNIIIVEENGHRLTKLNASGVAQWSLGIPGVDAPDNDHLNYPHAVATDKSGKIYVADNCRVQIIGPDGNYLNTLGTGCGTGNYEFGWVTGIAVDNNGNIYVVDYSNHRVQIYNSNRVYTARIGATGVCDTANNRLCNPIAVDVDASGNIYVTDGGNLRVQKFNSSRVWKMTIGDGTWGNSFDQLAWPEDVAVDAQGRIFVTDWDNNRVQVFDASGAYLTTIAGSWGQNSSQLRGAPGVDVDSSGNVYVADWENHRIQKFAPGVPGWTQKNINGFGDKSNWAIRRISIFNDYLYASTNNSNTGGEVWRTNDGQTWTQVNLDGFSNITNTGILVGEAFDGYLYAGTSNSATGAELWRCSTCDGTDWTPVVSDGFGDSNNTSVERVVVFSNTLYATVVNPSTGVEVWKSSTGDSGSWTQANIDGFGDAQNTGLWAVAVFNDYLYTATSQWDAFLNTSTQTGIEVWRTNDGNTWNQVNTDGFGNNNNVHSWLEPFNGYLYALAGGGTGITSTQIWRCATCDGSDWAQVVSDGFGDENNAAGGFMLGFDGYFYASTSNEITGTEIWRTANGIDWSQVNVDGFGDSNNVDVWGGTVFKGNLFLGVRNGWDSSANSGQIWEKLPINVTKNIKSAAAQDGWILESSETSNKGGTMNAAATLLYIGDDAKDKQYRSFVSFNTDSLPNNAVVTNVQLKFRHNGFAGDDMFAPSQTHGDLLVDIRKPYFGSSAGLVVSDFKASGSLDSVGTLTSASIPGWYAITLDSASFPFVNLKGITQFRLRFQIDDNDDRNGDYLKIYSGNAPTANRPQLIIEYHVP